MAENIEKKCDIKLGKELIITSKTGNKDYWREVWERRELVWALTKRDLQMRYKQTALGVIWVVLQPLLSALVLSLIFGRWGSEDSQVSYILIVWSGLVFWNFFSEMVNYGANSLVNQVDLIKKIYFPRVIILIANFITASFNFLVGSVCFWIISVVMGYYWSSEVYIWWLCAWLMVGLTGGGISLWLSAINVKWRDVKHTLPLMLQLGIFLTPVIYETNFLTEKWQFWSYLNPLTLVINMMREKLGYGEIIISGSEIGLSVGVIILVLTSGYFYFRNSERKFADLI